MELIEEINKSEWVFLEKAQVIENVDLELYFVIGKASEKPIQTIVGEGFPVDYNEQSTKYKVTFYNFIGHSILNESYDNIDTPNEIKKNGFRVYKKSNFLNYVLKDTFAAQVIDEEILHYFFFTQNHLINIASSTEPEIKKLNITHR
tara:strand:+ start:66 stop:506 length:441 start_codon:yes stop_codon:yes gene_type:complete